MSARNTNPGGVAFGSEFGGGISFREYVATAALQGLLACPTNSDLSLRQIVSVSVQYADALIAELSKPKKENE